MNRTVSTGILDLDVGNTFVKWRNGERSGRMLTSELSAESFFSEVGEPSARVRLASVACTEQQRALEDWSRQNWGVVVEIAKTQAVAAGVTNSYQEPARMGVDRWLAVLAAFNRFPKGCCVVDCGSAITVDYVDANGQHQGGYIMPGLHLMRKGLLSNTSRILANPETCDALNTSPGRCTEDAVSNGLGLMFSALAEQVGRSYKKQIGKDAELVVCGGDGGFFVGAAGSGLLVPDLVLDGLAYSLP